MPHLNPRGALSASPLRGRNRKQSAPNGVAGVPARRRSPGNRQAVSISQPWHEANEAHGRLGTPLGAAQRGTFAEQRLSKPAFYGPVWSRLSGVAMLQKAELEATFPTTSRYPSLLPVQRVMPAKTAT